MPILAWRVQQTTNTTGTGTLALNAAPAGRQSFFAAFGAGTRRVRFIIMGASFFELTTGDYDGGSPGTLTRAATPLASSTGALVSLPVGTADVIAVIDPSERSIIAAAAAVTLGVADLGNLVSWTGSSAQTATLPAVATAPRGIGTLFVNGGSAALTLDPSGAEQINGAATLVLAPGETAEIFATGTAWVAAASTTLAGFARSARFTASGTWVVPPGITRARVRLWGGGGGGGGNGVAGAAGGGGGGGYAEDILTGLVPGASISITIGAAGTAGANTGTAGSNNGGAGGTTSFGALLSATGGAGGGGAASSAGAAGVGGDGTGGGSNAILATGGSGSAGTGAGAGAVGGRGGSAAMGGGGGGTSTGVALPGGFPGGGGGAGAGTNVGRAGAAGLALIEF